MFRPPGAFGAAQPPPQQHPQPWQWQPPLQLAAATSFWQRDNVREHVGRLQETIELASAVINELEEITLARNSGDASAQEPDLSSAKSSSELDGSSDMSRHFVEHARAMKLSQETHESMATDAANYLFSQLQNLLAPIYPAVNQGGPWEERSAMIRLSQKLQKSKRNKRWRKRKRKHVAELFQKEHADYDRIDQDADEWRARQIAKDIAQRKVQNMKQIAKKKANEERKRLESELELALMVEKLQELRSIRVQKLKKQGHFLPEEDDKYLERVKAAVEEEERQAASAARTDAAKDAILTAEESRKAVQCTNSREDGSEQAKSALKPEQNQRDAGISDRSHHASQKAEHKLHEDEGKGHGHYDSVSSLPFEFYHYYHGSSYDMGTLIEVRRMWDSFIRPGGSRIPGHWVQPPPPADEVWASYLVQPK
ncbi:hypothetical protein E2562_039222 [Oryza meyeriana var. granulata]|uniref:Uncharacterized protein n=1 Tax=Oryza meyeriana var. granulata TaxID=110450 RepID=A0A6G1E9S5_9ORYZ|nr:hypothetical protein E2562_039222 [Oryza meyeriana var. granulata]KAF0921176.1 hypothetical protein E2562_039222 [Oryza meyeriana var. granulata]KAF0921179.1 hypothetical protein E2562_039222 [Oryza meyeriana var. granulata]KAF0921182.1 hypothetical protein E2562_039222 [Oryza meyeriana var. granulata]